MPRPCPHGRVDLIPPEDGASGLRLARGAIAEALGRGPLPDVAGLAQVRGAFVTIRAEGALRGCIGALEARVALRELVPELALSAAFEDPRFEPLAPDELDEVRLELSVLTPPRAVEGDILDALRVGTHGLVAEAGRARGLLLPQVAIEHDLAPETFLSLACRKAGLSDDAWRAPGRVRWSTFEAQVFEEPDARASAPRSR